MNIIARFFLFLLIAALIPPWTATRPAQAFSVGEERELGEKLLYTVRASFPLIDDPDIVQYITARGEEVLRVAGVRFFDFRFFVIDNGEFNAFAAPSGLIFFYSGLIGSMNSEDEFVSVLAHEIAHVKKRHLASRMEKSQVVTLASLGLALAGLLLGGGGAISQAVLTGSLAAGQSAQLHFSREDEEEADLQGYQWMLAMGRDPEGMRRMLSTMRRIARYRSERLPQYLLTHPESENRLEYVSALLEHKPPAPPVRDDFDFLRFKYRVAAWAAGDDNDGLRVALAGIIADSQASRERVAMAKFGLAEIERRDGNYDRARALLEEVIAAYPNKNILKTDLAVLEAAAGRFDKARLMLEDSLRRDGGDMYATLNLARILLRQKEWDAAEREFRALLLRFPEYPAAYFALGQIATARGRQAEAFWLAGTYHLYEGKLKSARDNFLMSEKEAGKGPKTDADMKKKATASLDLLDRLEGKVRKKADGRKNR
ncbi:MAG: M48 family metalloprotease [Desulfobulbaceae bacterium]|jgi:predicted Zn-dependent protease|nr:M48 family metalloprotease [Desulfobulbaceae bacterium]